VRELTKKQKPIVYMVFLLIALQLVSLAINANGLQNQEQISYTSDAFVDDSLIDAVGCSELAQWGKDYGYAYDIFIQETLLSTIAYIAVGSAGLLVCDVSNPSNPKIIGEYSDGDGITQVIVAKKYAYVTGGDFGLKILDISSPRNTKLVAEVHDIDSYLSNIEMSGDYIFGLQWGSILQIIDVRNPKNPIRLDTFQLSEVFEVDDIKIRDNYLYSISFDSVKIFEISDPSNPILIDTWTFGISIYGFDFYGLTAIIASNSEVFFYSMANPSNFTLISKYRDVRCPSTFIEVYDHYAFSIGDEGFICFDVENPSNIVKVSEYIKEYGYSFGGYKHDEFIYLIDHFRGLEIVYIGDLTTNPLNAGRIITRGLTLDTFVQGDLAYVTSFYGGIEILDIDNPTNPKLISRYSQSSSYYVCLYLENSKLYLANYLTNTIEILDVSDLNAPVRLSSAFDDQFIMWPGSELMVRENIAYICEYYSFSHIFEGVFHIVDCTNPANITKITTLTNLDAYFYDFDLMGNHLFLATSLGLIIYEIDNDYNLTLVSEYSDISSYIGGVFVENNHAFLAARDYGLIVLDVSDIENPVLASSYETGDGTINERGGYNIYLENNIAYMSDFTDGLLVFDCSNPNNPIPFGSYQRYEYDPYSYSGGLQEVYFYETFVYNDVVFLSAGQTGLLIVHHDDLPTHWMTLQNKIIISISTTVPLVIGGLAVLVILRIKKRR
jgi:hypothetical protein